MTRRQGTAQFVAGADAPRGAVSRGAAQARPGALRPVLRRVLPAALALALSGCGTVGLFGQYEIPESADVAAAPYPRLVDVPDAPPPGEYSEAAPNPVEGAVTQAELGAAATAAGARAETLAQTRPGAGLGGQPGSNPAAAAQARAAALSRPVIGAAEREALLARARAQRGR